MYLQVVWDEHFAGLFDHGLGLELLLAEAVPPGVKGLLARDTRQGNVRRVGVKGPHHLVTVIAGWGGEGGAGAGGGGGGGVQTSLRSA